MYLLKNKFILVFLSAFITGLAQHNSCFGFLNWFSLIPLVLVLNQINKYKHVFLYTFIWGFVYSFTTIFWIAFNNGVNMVVGIISMFATVLILCSNTILIGLIWFKIKSHIDKYKIFILPFVFT